ncbi:MAG: DsbC family protein [Hydrogenophaga sp.]
MDMQRRGGLKHLMAWGGLLTAGTAWGQKPERNVRSAQALTAIVERLTGAKVDAIAAGPLPGLHEVIVRGKVLYIDDAGEHLIEGHIVDIANRRSLTAQREAEYQIATTPTLALKDLDLTDAITIVRGSGREDRVLVSFEDPRCGFCKRLHATLAEAKDLTVHTFAVSFLGPESRALNERIWCAPSRAQAWADAMAGKPVAGAAACGFEALDRNMALAERYRVRGTPTLFTVDGRRINGAVGLDAIEAALAGKA